MQQFISFTNNINVVLYITIICFPTNTAYGYKSSNKLSNYRNKYNACIYRKHMSCHSRLLTLLSAVDMSERKRKADSWVLVRGRFKRTYTSATGIRAF